MTERKVKNNSIYLVIGIFLCLLCVMCIGILVYALVSTSAEKTRLESIGATVTMKFTWLFFADIVLVIASGVGGFYAICGKTHKGAAKTTDTSSDDENKRNPLDTEHDSSYDIETEKKFGEFHRKYADGTEYRIYSAGFENHAEGITEDEDSKSDADLIEKENKSVGSGLRINRGGSGKKPVSGEEGVSVRIDSAKKSEGSSFFSAGDDL